MTIDLDDLERKAKAATPGPWGEWSNTDDYAEPRVYEVGVMGPLRMYNDGSGGCTNDFVCETTKATYPEGAIDANAAFIAAANPAAVLKLVAEIRRWRALAEEAINNLETDPALRERIWKKLTSS